MFIILIVLHVTRNEMLEKIQIGNNHYKEIKESRNSVIVNNEKCCHYIDLTKDSPKNTSKKLFKNSVTETVPKNYILNNDSVFDTETVSSVASWTSSSDDILCSNTSRVIN